MGSQFVDLNADEHLDYLSATFDGSPHVAYGSAEGFAEPVRLKDKDGQVIGGIGVSGSSVENDHAVAQAGAKLASEI